MSELSAKEWLNRAWMIDYEIQALEDVKQEEWSRITSTTSAPDSIKVNSSMNPHKFDRMAELESMIDKRIADMIALKTEVLDFIANIPNTTWRTLLIYRYIRFMTWERIGTRMHYSHSQVRRLHLAALAYCDEILNKQ